MKAIIGTVLVAALALASGNAEAKTLCCDITGINTCTWSTTGGCPSPDALHQAWLTVAVPNNVSESAAGAVVELIPVAPFSGVCFPDHDTAGQYVVPKFCARLAAPPGKALATATEPGPWNGNAFAVSTTADFANYYAGGLYMSCFAGNDQKDDNGVATYTPPGGSGYTCSLTKQMTWNTAGVHGGNFHYLPGVNSAPFLGVQPRITATYGGHQVWHGDNFIVRTGSPNAAVYWHRTVNGVAKPVVQLGTTDAFGYADVWLPTPWLPTDEGATTLYVTAGSTFTSNTLSFNVTWW